MTEEKYDDVCKAIISLKGASEYGAAGKLYYQCCMAILFNPETAGDLEAEISALKLVYQGIIEAVIELKMSIRVILQ